MINFVIGENFYNRNYQKKVIIRAIEYTEGIFRNDFK